ncbi:MAG: hydroxymethylglutaryl-CoA synthase family protein [Deltaproteobacteria bacterium]|nr:MAG: hydroxymethylglutaryl-CoA synthase family protein [Deltaproteobacteria bacterium]
MKRTSQAGIDAISVYLPRTCLRLDELAERNGVAREKYIEGLGCRSMAVPAPGEDAVTMAWEAASSLLRDYEVDSESIGMLVVGTESGVDHAKPVAAYLHGMLGLSPECRIFDVKHACYGATAALRVAVDWCSSQARDNVKALVVATDIARYPVGSPGEPTQGAGAVAMLVGCNARCAVLEPFEAAVHASSVMDFWRPDYSSCAIVDGKYSVECYMKALERTWRRYKKTSGLELDDYDYLLFHAPFPKMVRKAFYRIWGMEKATAGEGDPAVTARAFERYCGPATWACCRTGNLYTGSLYLELASLLASERQRACGRRVGIFSYGSGSCSEFFSARIGPDAAWWENRTGVSRALELQREIDYPTYLEYRKTAEHMNTNGSYRAELTATGTHRQAVFLGIRDHKRIYSIRKQPSVRRQECSSHHGPAHIRQAL